MEEKVIGYYEDPKNGESITRSRMYSNGRDSKEFVQPSINIIKSIFLNSQ